MSARQNVLRNGYYAQSELLLVSMICDEDATIRKKGLDIILKLRNGSDQGDKSVRPFKVPKINLDCKNYTELIDWEKEALTEPIITADMTIKDLEELKVRPLDMKNFPCHSQGCERAVKETTRASANVVGWSARDGYIRLSGLSRTLMKKFNSKKDFISNIVE